MNQVKYWFYAEINMHKRGICIDMTIMDEVRATAFCFFPLLIFIILPLLLKCKIMCIFYYTSKIKRNYECAGLRICKESTRAR